MGLTDRRRRNLIRDARRRIKRADRGENAPGDGPRYADVRAYALLLADELEEVAEELARRRTPGDGR